MNSVRGPGGNIDRPPRLARDVTEAERSDFATDADGRLVFPGTVTRVEGVNLLYIKYDHTGDEEFVERAENVTPRAQMPWHPHLLQGQVVIMLAQNVRHGDAIEGLEVRLGPGLQYNECAHGVAAPVPARDGRPSVAVRWEEGRADAPLVRPEVRHVRCA